MGAPALNATRFARPALRAAVLYISIIMISLIAMVKPAHASGTVSPALTYCLYSSLNSWARPECGLSSADAACALVGTTAQTTTGTQGGCKSGYYYWTAVSICPIYTTSLYPPCTCTDPYVPDSAGTSCIRETYTIALSGLGVEVMSTKTLTTAYAHVAKNDGSDKSGAQVTLELTVVPEDDGQLYSAHVGSILPNGGATGADGRLKFVFMAPVAGGLHTITATCTGCTNNPVTGTIRVPGCTVEPLKELPTDDECAKSLDEGLGVDINHKCPPLDERLPGQIQCFANKISATNSTANPTIPYDGPTAKYRNAAYQAHLKDIWDTMIKLDNLSDPAKIMACQPLRNEVIVEKGCDSSDGCVGACMLSSHCIRSTPATFSNHTKGTAFDVPKDTINGLLNELIPRPPAPMAPSQQLQAQRIWIADWLAKPAACNLYWGGNFADPEPDFIHFQLH
jgi:hypothetical protein